MVNLFPQFGARAKGESLRRILASPNFNGKVFVNQIPTPMRVEGVNYRKLIGLMFKKDPSRTPPQPLPYLIPLPSENPSRPSGFTSHFTGIGTQGSFFWFGHSTVLLNLNGTVILTDPMFSKRASPFSFMGPKAFNGSTPVSVDDLPDPDIILISHDHYDHLDFESIRDQPAQTRIRLEN